MLRPRTIRCRAISFLVPSALVFAAAAGAADDRRSGAAPIPSFDGPPAEFVGYVERVKALRPAADDYDALHAHLIGIHTAIIAAAEHAAAADPNSSELTAAVTEKLASLRLLRRLEVPDAAARLHEYLQALANDARPFIRPLGRIHLLAARLQSLHPGDARGAEALLIDVREHVRSAPRDERNLSLAYRTALVAEQAGLRRAATEAYREFAAYFAQSNDAETAAGAERLAGAARLSALVDEPGEFQLTGRTLDGRPFDWSAYRGKTVLVQFWSTGCGACAAELPNLRECIARYRDRGFAVVGVSLDDDRRRLREFVDREQLPWPVLFEDGAGWEHPAARRYGILSLPRAVLVAPDGRVISIDAHGEALWTLLAERLGPAEVKPSPPGAVKPPTPPTNNY